VSRQAHARAAFPDAIDDWSTGIGAWASTAQAPPPPTTPEEGRHDMNDNHGAPPSATDGPRATATDRAVQAGERLLEATTKVGNACADAYQDAVINMADFRERLGDADWPSFGPPAGLGSARRNGRPLGDVADTAARVNDTMVGAIKKLGLAYVEAYEEMVLCVVELREQAAAASDNPVMQTAGSTGADVARDATKAYVEAARRLLA
jgi:hypothetical protein